MVREIELQAPVFLVAMPQVKDPFFSHSVILLAAHDAEGSLGFIVNRPVDLPIHDILDDLEIGWCGPADAPAFLGGPVQPQVGTVLCASAEVGASLAIDGNGDSRLSPEIAPGVSLTQNLKALERLAADPPQRLRLLLGYAGWSAGQLEEEVARHDWLLCPVDLELVFASTPAEVWARTLESVGIDPATLSEWTHVDTAAN